MSYDTSPELRDLRLSAEDLEELSRTAGSQLAGSPAAVRHLLARMRATLSQENTERQELRKQLAQLQEGLGGGVERMMSDLARLTPKQREELLGTHLRSREAELQELQENLEMEAVAARSQAARILVAARQIAEEATGDGDAFVQELMRRTGLSAESGR